MNTTENLNGRSTFWSNLFKTPAERSDLKELLLSIPPFQNFNSNHIKNLIKIIHNRVYNSVEYIFYQGDPGIALYIIRDGEIKIVKNTDDGGEMELARFGRGDFFGELALVDNDVRSASAVAVTNSQLAVIFKPDLDKFIEKFPRKGNEILRGLAQIIATRLRLLDDEYLSLYQKTISKYDGVENE